MRLLCAVSEVVEFEAVQARLIHIQMSLENDVSELLGNLY